MESSRESSINNYFVDLELRCKIMNSSDYLLWPTTPINARIQKMIKKRYGCEDLIEERGSRPNVICKKLYDLISSGKIKPSFSILDICCGDALILMQIKTNFVNCMAMGFDLNKDKFDSHQSVKNSGVKLYYGFIQELFRSDLPYKIDVGIMLNTFRSWHTAGLKDRDKDLPFVSQTWLLRNFENLFLTVNQYQFHDLGIKNNVEMLGCGEEKSYFIHVGR